MVVADAVAAVAAAAVAAGACVVHWLTAGTWLSFLRTAGPDY